MCGRFTQAYSWAEVHAFLRLLGLPQNLRPRYNIAPTQEAGVVRLGAEGHTLDALRWGLVPAWAKDLAIGSKLINARGETVAEKPSFRAAFRARRCIVPTDGFYEWRGTAGRKQPCRIVGADRKPFAFAGLWESWPHGPYGPIESFTIITTQANARLRPIHARMPVILDPADFDAWLDPALSANDALSLLRPAPDEAVDAYPVSTRVNNVRNDDEACIEPASEREAEGERDQEQKELF